MIRRALSAAAADRRRRSRSCPARPQREAVRGGRSAGRGARAARRVGARGAAAGCARSRRSGARRRLRPDASARAGDAAPDAVLPRQPPARRDRGDRRSAAAMPAVRAPSCRSALRCGCRRGGRAHWRSPSHDRAGELDAPARERLPRRSRDAVDWQPERRRLRAHVTRRAARPPAGKTRAPATTRARLTRARRTGAHRDRHAGAGADAAAVVHGRASWCCTAPGLRPRVRATRRWRRARWRSRRRLRPRLLLRLLLRRRPVRRGGGAWRAGVDAGQLRAFFGRDRLPSRLRTPAPSRLRRR